MTDSTLPTISAVVYSMDEAELLGPCLARIQGFDEVVVCDMQSTDNTRQIAERYSARLVGVPRARVIEEVRQLGVEAAQSEWVLFVDADEHLPAGFADDLRTLICSSPAVVGWRLGYSNTAFGHPLSHVLRGSAKFSLVRAEQTFFPLDGRAHVPPRFEGPTGDGFGLVPLVLHHNFRSPEQTVEKILRYAPDVTVPSSLTTPTGLILAAIRRLIFAGAWRDGLPGCTVVTAQLFGDWYSAVLAADRVHVLGSAIPPTERRVLAALTGGQKGLVSARKRLALIARKIRRARSGP